MNLTVTGSVVGTSCAVNQKCYALNEHQGVNLAKISVRRLLRNYSAGTESDAKKLRN